MKLIAIVLSIVTLLLPLASHATPLALTPTDVLRQSAQTGGQLPADIRVLSTSDSAIELALDTPGYEISQIAVAEGVFDVLHAPGYDVTREPGLPQLPMQAALLAIPPGAVVSVEATSTGQQTLPGRLRLLPAPRTVIPETDPTAADVELPAPIKVYAASNDHAKTGAVQYPGSLAQVGDIAFVRNQRVAPVRLYPFQADLESGTVIFHQHLRVVLRFSYPAGRQEAAVAPPESLFVEELLHSAILNGADAAAWRQPAPPAQAVTLPQAPATGEFRLSVAADGLYRVTNADLVAAGLNAASVNPQQFAMRNRDADVAIFVSGEADGRFDANDYIEFYGQAWNTNFTKTNVYWLDVDGPAGPRMATRSVAPGNGTTPASFRATVRFEQEQWRWTQHLRENKTWWWQKYTLYDNPTATQVTATLDVQLPSVANQTQPVGVRVAMASNTDYAQNPDHHVRAYFNDTTTPVEEQIWNGREPIELSGVAAGASLTPGVSTLYLRAVFDMGTPYAYDIYYLDWLEVTYDRLYTADNGQLHFGADAAGSWRFAVGGFADIARVFDLTNPRLPVRLLDGQMNGGQLIFQDTAGPETRLYAATDSALRTPTAIQRYEAPPHDLRATNRRADYLIIVHASLLDAIQPLVQFRTGQGMAVEVVDVAWLYDQFNAGILDPQGIKNFISYAYHNWASPAPSFALLVGDANFNPMGYNPAYYGSLEQTYVPTFNLTIDPYTGEVAVDNEFVTVAGNDILPDLYVGRMAGQTAAEVAVMVEKTIAYERTTRPGDWRQRTLFVADNYLNASGAPDPAGNFEEVIQGVVADAIPNWYSIDRVFYDPSPNPPPDAWRYPTVAQTRDAVAAALNNGALFTNYVGHATIDKWAENLWTTSDVSLLTNLDRLTIALSMDCLDGYFDWPNRPSLAETMIEYAGGGTVAHWAPTGLGVATGHDLLHKGFLQAVNSQGIDFFGGAVTAGRLKLAAIGAFPDLVQSFMMFGDPALHFVVPASPQELAVSLSSTPGDVVGEESMVDYVIRYDNRGSVAATNVNLQFPLPDALTVIGFSASGPSVTVQPGPSYLWNIAEIPVGASGVITVQAQVKEGITVAQAPIVTVATLRNRWIEPEISNNTAQVSLDVLLADRYEADDSQATAAALPAIGQPMRHTLHTSADVDWAWFDAAAGQRFFLHTSQLTQQGNTALTLFAANGAQLAHNNDFSPGSRWSGLNWTAPAAGRYFVRIGAEGSPGPFAYDLIVDWQKRVYLPIAHR